MKLHIWAIIVLIIGLTSCKDSFESKQLNEIAAVANNNPNLAIRMLDSIDVSQLSHEGHHFHNFLTIKARDKAYITHTSDSLIKIVINYYESNLCETTAEALYYGGRVYFDLGDTPKALSFFQKSLDTLDPDSLELKGRIVSQMARLYYNQYIYSDAIAKARESIEIDTKLNDYFGLAYDNCLIGDIHLASNKLDSATFYYKKALEISRHLSKGDEAIMKVCLAYSLSGQNRDSEAVKLIPMELLNDIPKNAQSLALSKYIHIYRKCGYLDITRKLIFLYLNHDNSIETKSTAYGALAELDITSHNTDSLYSHIKLYKWATDSLNRNISTDAIKYQNSYYNYAIRERENLKLTKEKLNQTILIYLITTFCLVLGLTLLYFINANKRKKLKLELSILKLNQLDQKYTELYKKLNSSAELKKALISKIQQRIESLNRQAPLPTHLKESTIYKELVIIAEDNSKIMKEHHWVQLSNIIESTFPNFKSNLSILLNSYSEQEYRICMLLKCNFTPTRIAKLTFRTKNAISNSRLRMSQRAFNDSCGSSYWDDVVRSL